MDIILEVCDTFALDHVYAKLFPAGAAPYDILHDVAGNATRSAVASSWQYEPATSYFTLNPGPAAYASSLPRDNIYRQFVSLFAIVW